jgi:hypothetical protein
MIQVRTKDKIFVSVLLPILAICGFLYAVRSPAVKECNQMKARISQLPEPEMFPMMERRLKEKVESAKLELEKVKAEKMPDAKVVADKTASIASRREEVLRLIKMNGASVITIEPVESKGFVHDVLRKTGVCSSPGKVKILLEGEYKSITGSLKEIEEKKMALVVESIELRAGDKCKWEILLWF